jgi:hypothetical protein
MDFSTFSGAVLVAALRFRKPVALENAPRSPALCLEDLRRVAPASPVSVRAHVGAVAAEGVGCGGRAIHLGNHHSTALDGGALGYGQLELAVIDAADFGEGIERGL